MTLSCGERTFTKGETTLSWDERTFSRGETTLSWGKTTVIQNMGGFSRMNSVYEYTRLPP